jgi:Fe-S cluster assembly iron-binding protein IscA
LGEKFYFGFTDLNEDDFQVRIANIEEEIYVIVDPFAAFYLQEASVDFVQDFEQDAEGFVIVNHAQSEFRGKFWKSSPEKAPPMKTGALNA